MNKYELIVNSNDSEEYLNKDYSRSLSSPESEHKVKG